MVPPHTTRPTDSPPPPRGPHLQDAKEWIAILRAAIASAKKTSAARLAAELQADIIEEEA